MRKLLIVDLEATCWERPKHAPEAMETIEIGALLVDPAAPARPSEYQGFVRPVRFPELSEFCKRLTGIAQADVDSAEPFSRAFPRFLAWIGDPGAVRFASWGNYDRLQLLRDCAGHGLAYPFADDHLNLKHHCGARLGIKPGGLQPALKRAGLSFEGSHHRGLDDARNIWRVLLAAEPDAPAGLV
jgi:inhibitor of KinA sporulation pathway (predicted exonuclease)